ncbi:hypothetical protein F8388_016962 [Cannabis sativa]|uniref:Endoglucanase n=1 Tax=Cannabis sativa TaxID=3483 RepID=A0A7J6H2Q1_CANSA|nr:hypothetical protein F8388_016962 [Cannabis sativa]KAF4389474.1 hypothetical protein G4B88_006533 [Cannabis sativa]
MTPSFKFSLKIQILTLYLTSLLSLHSYAFTSKDYTSALEKSILFFEGQRSGKLSGGSNQRLTWRGDSALSDGSSYHVDLSGGYYDAGDNVKFGLPMAFTTTLLSWSVIEFGDEMGNQIEHARDAIRWGTDYLLKAATSTPETLYVQVGDPNMDHRCWERPEDMDTPRNVYKVTTQHPGSDVAAETAAALAAASIVFKSSDPSYSNKLLQTAKKVFDFADKHRGSYSDSLNSVVCPFYCSYSGYHDELLWGASWIHRASGDSLYLDYIKSNGHTMGSDDDSYSFSWDDKRPGTKILLSKYLNLNGGVTTCGGSTITVENLVSHAKKQVDYILGDNPSKMSYMVGFGEKYPQHVHHRGSSLPSIHSHPSRISCNDGFQYLNSGSPNPNVLVGAVVGGPDSRDNFSDDRNNYQQSEPATYINAPFVGALAYFSAKS